MHYGRRGTAHYRTEPGEVGDLTLHHPGTRTLAAWAAPTNTPPFLSTPPNSPA
jgi:hypothetical protein